MFRRHFVASILLLIVRAAIGESQEKATAPAYKLDKDIPYRTGTDLSTAMKERCKLDVYYPSEGKNLPSVVWFHGGGLKMGEKSVPAGLRGKGVIVVAVNYRLSPTAKSPEYVEDAAAATAWAFGHIEKYGGSRKLIFVSGHSAGGYLTSMIGLDRKWLQAHKVDADAIAGLIPLSGQTATHSQIRAERGIGEKQPIVDELAPLYHVRKDAPPILLISGDRNKELNGRYEENAYLWRMLKVVGHPRVELLELQGYDHGGMAEPAYPLLLKFVRERSKELSAVR